MEGKAVLTAMMTCLIVVASSLIPAWAGATVTCRQYAQSGKVPASLLPSGTPLPYTLAAELCARRSDLRDGATVQLLIHGGTYNHSYWDFGTVNGTRYSYARDLAAAGFPTFAIDQIGAGRSSKPASAVVTGEVAAYVAHELIQRLRAGSIAGIRFGKVIVVGHSLGAVSAWQEAIRYQDVDGLIVTGLVHHSAWGKEADARGKEGGLYSAVQDRKFLGSGLDPGYLTTRPGARGVFYGTAADPSVIAADDNDTPYIRSDFNGERGKDVFPAGEVHGLMLLSSTATQAIEVPVLIVLGRQDATFCGPDARGVDFDCSSGSAIVRQERPYYSPRAQLQACSVPDSGHCVSLHPTHSVQTLAAIAWSYRFVGQRGRREQSGPLPQVCGFSP